MAAAYAQTGQFPQAVKWQTKATTLAPNHVKASLRSRLEHCQRLGTSDMSDESDSSDGTRESDPDPDPHTHSLTLTDTLTDPQTQDLPEALLPPMFHHGSSCRCSRYAATIGM